MTESMTGATWFFNAEVSALQLGHSLSVPRPSPRVPPQGRKDLSGPPHVKISRRNLDFFGVSMYSEFD